MPALVWSDAAIGGITREASALTGLPTGVPVVIGSSDGATDPVGAGLGAGSTALLRYGSTLGVTVITAGSDVVAPGLWRTPGNRRGEVMFVGGLSTAGSVTSWFREQLARELDQGSESAIVTAHGTLLAEAAGSPPGAGGVLALPYFAGERTPFADPDARGVVVGIGLGTRRGDLYRSVLEGAAFGLRHMIEVVGTGTIPIDLFRSVGGGTAVTPHLGAPLGAARLAAEGTGLIEPGAPAWVSVARTIEPRPELRETYDRLYSLFRRLYVDSHDVVLGLREWRV
jgi:xylulokinase